MKLKDILEFPRSQEYVFHTDLSVGECVNKLRNTVVRHESFAGLVWDEVFSIVKGNKFVVKTRTSRGTVSHFWGILKKENTFTSVSGHFGVSWFYKICLFVELIFFLIILLILPIWIVIFTGFVIIIVVISTIGSTDDEELKYTISTLNAIQIQPVPSVPKPPKS